MRFPSTPRRRAPARKRSAPSNCRRIRSTRRRAHLQRPFPCPRTAKRRRRRLAQPLQLRLRHCAGREAHTALSSATRRATWPASKTGTGWSRWQNNVMPGPGAATTAHMARSPRGPSRLARSGPTRLSRRRRQAWWPALRPPCPGHWRPRPRWSHPGCTKPVPAIQAQGHGVHMPLVAPERPDLLARR